MEEGNGGEGANSVALNGDGIIDKWLEEHGAMYDRATRHPFVISIRDGTVDISCFKRWLAQDYLFVREFIPFTASLLLKTWKSSKEKNDIEVILGAMASLHDEISWFKREAAKWDVSLVDIIPQKANDDYCRFLQSLMQPEADYTTTIVAFWAIESVYQQCFSLCLEESSSTPLELLEACQRWGDASFREYCHALQKIAIRCLENASEDVVRRAKEAFLNVLEHEVKFWDMSNGET